MRYSFPTVTCWPASAPRALGRRRTLCDSYLRLHGFVLLGYALGGRTFAYLGLGPLYVGELALACGIAATVATRAALRIPRSPTVYALGALFAWCGWLTLVGVAQHGMDALRDSVLWAYSLFGLVVACALVSQPLRLRWLMDRYVRFGRIFVLLMPGIWTVSALYGDQLPRLPGTDVSLLQVKATDTLVHLAGIAGFQFLGLAPVSPLTVFVFLVGFIVLSTRSRGAMLAVALAMALLVAIRPMRRRVWISAAVVVGLLPFLLTLDFGVTIAHRELSSRQFIVNALSIFDGDVSHRLEGTKQWRVEWWSKIVDYTVFGPHFWTGKGFGVNLARDDGFELGLRTPLRSPHNIHLTVLARTGVPGFLLWEAVQIAWLWEMARAYRASRRRGRTRWARLFLFLIAYWLAMIVNASFDVALEGPMAGVWFWSVIGVGLAAARIHRRSPGVLEPVVPTVRPPAPIAPLPRPSAA